MAEQRDTWSVPPAGWQPPPAAHPSGLFPGGPARPTYREPHPVRTAGVLAGLGAGSLWFMLTGLLARDLRGYAWFALLAGSAAWAVSALLARVGDRGVAVGVAVATAIGWSVAATVVALRWAASTDWPMW